MSAEMEVLVSEFLNADEQQQEGLWKQADVAAIVEERFGGDSPKARAGALRSFASEVQRSASTLRKYARTSRFFPQGQRIADQPFTLHRIAANHCPTPEQARVALDLAATNGWSTRELQDYLVRSFGLKLEGEMIETEDDRLLLDNEDLAEQLRRFAGLRVRVQLRVVGQEEDD